MIHLLHHIIERKAARSPDRQVFRCRQEALTYRQLDERSSQLAATLQQNGVQPGDRVAICMPKCLEMPVSVFGCLKAGAVYTPVDPASPVQRMTALMDDAEVSAVLTIGSVQHKAAAAVAALRFRPKLVVSETDVEFDTENTVSWHELRPARQFRAVELIESDPAYIIYTSGSTGLPKGILHSHRSGLSYARLAVDCYSVRADDRAGNFAPLHFDQSTFEFFAVPLAGACTVLITEEYMRFPASLARLIEDERLTFWYSVPFALVQLLLRGALDDRDLSSLRWVLYGGEPFPVRHLQQLMAQLPNATFSNVYGPAEVNQCTFYHFDSVPKTGAAIPLGKVWANTDAIIVNQDCEAVPCGEVGELLIHSATMMDGYWNRPDLNKVCFLDVQGTNSVLRYFRTGDLVRQTKNGNLEFHGRRDRQLKIRGNRVELDEVEFAASSIPDVEEAAATAVHDNATEDRIVALAVVLVQGSVIQPSEILRNLTEVLPGYAVPTHIRICRSLPQTSTGKTDYPALTEHVLGDPVGGVL